MGWEVEAVGWMKFCSELSRSAIAVSPSSFLILGWDGTGWDGWGGVDGEEGLQLLQEWLRN